MSIIIATKNKETITCIQPDSDTEETIKDLHKRGYEDIQDSETGEKY
jgi:hypothetical protein